MKILFGSIAYSQENTHSINNIQAKQVRILYANFHECEDRLVQYMDHASYCDSLFIYTTTLVDIKDSQISDLHKQIDHLYKVTESQECINDENKLKIKSLKRQRYGLIGICAIMIVLSII